MKGLFPYALVSQHDLDSGALTMKCVVAHVLTEPGTYHGIVRLDERFVGGFIADVTLDDTLGSQAPINLSALHRHAGATAPNEVVRRYRLKAGGSIVLHVGDGEGGYHVVLRGGTGGIGAAVWDSRYLGEGDSVSMIPIRPGTYRLGNTVSTEASTSSLVVSYPDPRQNRREAPRPAPTHATFDRRGFDCDAFHLRPGQGIVIAVKSAARFVLTLETPDDGPEDLRRWRALERAELLRIIEGKPRSSMP
jgi:hypothetical protein